MQHSNADRHSTVVASALLFAAILGTLPQARAAPGDKVTHWIRTECDAASRSATVTLYYTPGYEAPPGFDPSAAERDGQGGRLNFSIHKAWCALPDGRGVRAVFHNVPGALDSTWAAVWIDKIRVADVDLSQQTLESVRTDFTSYRICHYDLARGQDEGDLSRAAPGTVRIGCTDGTPIAGRRDQTEFPHLAGEGVIDDTGSAVPCALDPPKPTQWQLVSGFAGQRLTVRPQHPRQCNVDESTCTGKAYLVAGDLVQSAPACDGWSYVSFTESSRTTSGWVVSWRLAREEPDSAAAAASRKRFRAHLEHERVASALDSQMCEAVVKGDVTDAPVNPVTPYLINVEALVAAAGVGSEHRLEELVGGDVLIVATGTADIENNGHPLRFGIAQAGEGGRWEVDYEWPILLDETGMPASGTLSARLFRYAGDSGGMRIFRFGKETYLERRRSELGAPTLHEVWRLTENAATRMCWIQEGTRSGTAAPPEEH